jgi:hypothetical protein
MDALSLQVDADSIARSWMNIDDLKCMALSRGCTPVEFARAAKMMGSHPFRVARYLKRHSFVPRTFDIPQGGRFPAWEGPVQHITAKT